MFSIAGRGAQLFPFLIYLMIQFGVLSILRIELYEGYGIILLNRFSQTNDLTKGRYYGNYCNTQRYSLLYRSFG